MLKPQGYVTIVGDFAKAPTDGGVVERDTISCGHCQRLVFVKPHTVSTVYLIPQFMGPDKEEPGAGCSVCRRPVCLACYALGTCHVWERKIDEMEARGAFRRAAGLVVLLLSLVSPAYAQVIAGGALTGVACTPTITTPTYDGSAATVDISGVAYSDNGVASVSYVNSLGGSGTATGTTSWSITALALTVGANVITVSCLGRDGAINTNLVTLTRSAPSGSETTLNCVSNTCYYIRDGGSASTAGTGACVSTGSGNWNTANACDTLPTTLVRGAYYVVAVGNYGGRLYDTNESGTTPIRIYKATVTNHGTDTGWQASYHNQAVFSSTQQFTSDDWEFNGQYRLECTAPAQLETTTCWRSGYGFKLGADAFELGQENDFTGAGAVDNITIKFAEAEGSHDPFGSDRNVRIALGSSNLTISKSYLHDTGETNIHAKRVNGLTVEYTWIKKNCQGPSHCEGIVLSEGTSNVIIRHSFFDDLGSTAHIGSPTGGHGGCGWQQASSNWYLYGNVFTVGLGTSTSGDGIVSVFDLTVNGDFFFHNNTVVGLDNGAMHAADATPDTDGDGCIATLTARNNLYVSVIQGGVLCTNVTSCTVTHGGFWSANNSVSGTSTYVTTGAPLTDYPNNDFSLTSSAASAMDAGFTLSSPYATDMFGCARGTGGKWDRGALEFGC